MAFSLLWQVREYYRTRVGAARIWRWARAWAPRVPLIARAWRRTSPTRRRCCTAAILAPFLPVGAPWWSLAVYVVTIMASAAIVFSLIAVCVDAAVQSRLLSVTH